MTSIDDVMIEITPQVLLKAYACGIFPMAESAEDNALYWIEPERRGILPLDHVHVPRRLARTIRQRRLRGQGRQDLRGGDRRLRRAARGPAQHLDQRADQEPLSRSVRARPLPHDRGLARGRAGRRPLWRASRPCIFRREHVLEGARREQDRPRLSRSRGSNMAASPCSTRSSSPDISPGSARSRSAAKNFSVCSRPR